MEDVCEPLCILVHSGGTDAGCNLEMHQFSFGFVMQDTNVPLNPHYASTAGGLVRLFERAIGASLLLGWRLMTP
jgi:hypothetical protein